MNPETLQSFFGWCTVINVGILVFWTVALVSARSWVYRFHGKLFRLSEEKLSAIHYTLLGGFKMAIILFTLVPWIALKLIS
ncbi:MAG: DUF6868 family protein [Verrucomicrobiota bacterium]